MSHQMSDSETSSSNVNLERVTWPTGKYGLGQFSSQLKKVSSPSKSNDEDAKVCLRAGFLDSRTELQQFSIFEILASPAIDEDEQLAKRHEIPRSRLDVVSASHTGHCGSMAQE